jgi:predicted dehydrogenase/nucleoside-diphosphate-sugar epimerase
VTQKIRVAVIGCGAISQQWHLPILMGHESFSLIAVVDNSQQMLDLIQSSYNVEVACRDINQLPFDKIDAVIIATPVAFHFPMTKLFLEKGIHVLVEKPIALDYQQSQELVLLAKQKNVVLAVGLYRRLFPSIKLLKKLVEEKTWGSAESFTFNWGGFYNWSATSLGNMSKKLAGGGVLMDLGPHALDWLTYIFGEKVTVTEYCDDALGGIDADCSMNLAFEKDESHITGKVNLSRVRNLGGELLVNFTEAQVCLGVGERYDLTVSPKKGTDSKDVAVNYKAREEGIEDLDWFESFRAEFDDFEHAIQHKHEANLSGQSVLPAMAIIDHCYNNRKDMLLDWVSPSPKILKRALPFKKVLITGASGFIGGRVAEIISAMGNVEIRAAVNNPNNASRLSRLPVEMVTLDLKDDAQVSKAVEGCDAVIHCAVGTAYGQDKEIHEVTVNGTKRLTDASIKYGVKRFIHLSSIAVMDLNTDGIVTEVNSKANKSTDLYAVTKLQAEEVVKAACQRGLRGVVLRPTNVYGPYSPLFKIGAGQQLLNNGLKFNQKTANSPINSVYIDNLVECILCALNVDEGIADGRFYLVNDNDGTTYHSFYNYFSEQFNKPLKIITKNKDTTETNQDKKPTLLSEVSELFSSLETKSFLKQIFNAPKLGTLPRYLFEKFPNLENRFRDSSLPIYDRQTIDISPMQIDSSTPCTISSDKAIDELDYHPPISRGESLQHSAEWIKFAFYSDDSNKELL